MYETQSNGYRTWFTYSLFKQEVQRNVGGEICNFFTTVNYCRSDADDFGVVDCFDMPMLSR